MTEKELLKRIQQLSFAKLETQLYLDTHPDNKAALEYFHKLHEELDGLVDEYQGKHGALFANGARTDKWNWVDMPWPWQKNDDGNKSM